jgi:hypothetical protein
MTSARSLCESPQFTEVQVIHALTGAGRRFGNQVFLSTLLACTGLGDLGNQQILGTATAKVWLGGGIRLGGRANSGFVFFREHACALWIDALLQRTDHCCANCVDA